MKKIFLSAMVLAAAVGCAQKNNVVDPVGGPVAIQLGSTMEGVTASRAAYSGDIALENIQFLRTDVEGATIPTSFAGKLPFAGARAVGGAITFGSPQIYNTDTPEKNAFFAAYFPVGALTSNVITWTIDGKTDVMTAAAVNAGTKTVPLQPSLALKHELAQIEVICKAASTSSAIQTRWGKITAIKVSNTPTTVTYDLATLKAVPSLTLGNLTMVKPGYTEDFAAIDVPANTNVAVNAVAMMAPMASQIFNLEVVTEKDGTTIGSTKIITVDLGAGQKIERAKKHVITLTFHPVTVGDPITVTAAAIEDWGVGATGTGSLL